MGCCVVGNGVSLCFKLTHEENIPARSLSQSFPSFPAAVSLQSCLTLQHRAAQTLLSLSFFCCDSFTSCSSYSTFSTVAPPPVIFLLPHPPLPTPLPSPSLFPFFLLFLLFLLTFPSPLLPLPIPSCSFPSPSSTYSMLVSLLHFFVLKLPVSS